jgi:hypothetical protein
MKARKTPATPRPESPVSHQPADAGRESARRAESERALTRGKQDAAIRAQRKTRSQNSVETGGGRQDLK